jgi:hypothetical protein
MGVAPLLPAKSGNFVARPRVFYRQDCLIEIKVTGGWLPRISSVGHWGVIDMPIETILFVAGVVLAFAAFMAALAWGELQTRDLSPPPGPAE